MESFSILALGGGGIKGYLQIGVLEELQLLVGPLHNHFKDGIYGCSIGSILATAISFGIPVENIKNLFNKFSDINSILKKPEITDIKNILVKKGICEMDSLEKIIIEGFQEFGIDIKNKKLSDALIPLKINSSNVTKGIPTIFQGNIPVLTAIKCSCCIPLVFRPQIFNGSVYLDGGFITNILLNVIPKEYRKKTFCISIIHTRYKISASSVDSMNPLDFLYKLYKTNCMYEASRNIYSNNLDVFYDKGSGITSFTQEEKDEMILIGRRAFLNFLTKSILQKSI
jgi:predicted acylesterase/phospholipase RssA